MSLNNVFILAVEQRVKVKMIYQKKNEVIERIITPISFNGKHIHCYDHFKKEHRNYTLSNILAAQIIRYKDDE